MDSINITRLVNNTGESIEVCVLYDKPYLDSLKLMSYEGFLKQSAERADQFLISIDTMVASVTYKVAKNQTIDAFHGSGSEPDFRAIHSVTVRSVKGTSVYSRNIISQSLAKQGSGFWEWVIK